MAAHVGLTTRAGDMISSILDPLIALTTPCLEDQSTEEAICQLEEAGDDLRQNLVDNAAIGSLDVCSLYPSIPHEAGAAEVARFITEIKDFEIEGVDTRAAQTFIASTMTPQEIVKEGIAHLIPKRRHKWGPRPGQTTDELSKQRNKIVDNNLNPDNSKEDTKWEGKQITNNNGTLLKLVSVVIKLAILNVVTNHCYTYDGKTYRQQEGLPIGYGQELMVKCYIFCFNLMGQELMVKCYIFCFNLMTGVDGKMLHILF